MPPSRLVVLLEVLRLDVLQPLPQLLRIVGLDRLRRFLRDLHLAGLRKDLLLHEDGGGHAQRQRDGVRGARVDGVLGLAELEVEDGEERVVLEVGHDDLEHLDLERLEDVLDQIVRHRPRRRDLLQVQRDGVGLEDADPDRQRALVVLVAQDDDRHVRHRIEREPAHFHLDEHTASSGIGWSAARRLCGSTSVTRAWTTSPTRTRPRPSKFTTRLQRVRPESSPALRRATPSTSTSTVAPASRAARAAVTRWTISRRRRLRSAFTGSGTCSGISAAGVPGRREYRKAKTLS